MKRLIVILVTCIFSLHGKALTYYSKSSGNLELTSSWGILTNGGGVSPLNFTTSGDVFIIVNNATPTIGANWTVTGTITVGDGSATINFTVPSAYKVTGTVNVTNNATITIGTPLTSATAGTPAFGTLSTGSTVVFNGSGASQVIPVATYYNLTVNNSSGIDLGTNIKETINGTLTFTQGDLQLNTSKLVLAGTVAGMSATKCFTGNSGGTGSGPDIFIQTSGNCGTIYMNQTTINNTDRADSFVVNSGASVTLGNNMTVKSAYVLNGTLNDGGHTIYVRLASAGTGTQTGGGCDSFANPSGTTSVPVFGATVDNIKFNDGVGFGYNMIGNLTVTGAMTFLTSAGGAKNKLSIGSNTLTLSGTVSGMSAANSFTGSATSNITVNSSGSVGTIYMDQTTVGTTNKVATFTNNTGGTTTLGNGISVGTALALTAGTLANGGNAIALTGNITGTGTESGTGAITMTTSGSTISGATISNLTFNNAGGFSLSGSPTFTGALTFTAGKLSLGANTLTLNGTVASMSATNSITGSASSNITVGTAGFVGTIYFDQTTAGTTNKIATFTNNTTGTTTLGNTVVVNTTLALTAGTLANGSNAITVNGSITGTGTESGLGVITMTTAGTTVSGATISNLTTGISSGTITATGSLTITNNLTTTAGGTLDMDTYPLSATAATISNSGTIKTQNTSSTPLPTGKTWGGTVNYYAATGGQTIMAGTYNNLTLGNTSGTSTASGAIVTNGTLTTTAGGTFNLSTYTLTGTLSTIANNGTIETQNTATPIPINLTWGGTVLYDNTTTTQTVSNGTYNNLTVGGASGTVTYYASNNFVVNGILTVALSTTTFDLQAKTLSGTMTSAMNYGTIATQNPNATPVPSGVNWAASGTGTFLYNNTSGNQHVVAGTYYNLGIGGGSGTRTHTMDGALTVNGTLTITATTTLSASASNFQITMGGNWVNNGTAFSAGSGTVLFNGSSAQSIGGTTTTPFYNLTLNKSGSVSLATDESVSNTLTLTSGNLDVTTHILTLASSATAVAGSSFSASNMIIADGGGEVRKSATSAAQATYTFPVGDNTGTAEYSPVTLTFSGGSYAGYGSVKVINAKHASNASTVNYLKRYWTIRQSGFSAYSVVVAATYVAADVTGTQGSIIMGKWDGSAPWTRFNGSNVGLVLTSSGTTLAPSDFTGINAAPPTVSIAPANPAICAGNSVSLTASGAGDPTLTYSWSPATGLSATTGTSVVASPTVTTVYTVTVTDGNSLSGTNTVTVNVTPIPTAAPTNDGPICIGGTINLTANAVGATSYTWSGANLSSTTGATTSATPASNATYSLVVTTNGCSSTVFTTAVSVVAKPTASPANDGPICTTGTVNLTSNPSGGTGGYTYSWSGSNLSSAVSANPSATPTSNAIYSLTVSNAASGCVSNVYTTSVTVASKPTAIVSNNGAICTGGTVTLSGVASGGTGGYLYSWSGPSLASATTAAPTATPVSSSVYSLTVSNAASGCNPSTVYTTSATVNAKPSAAPANDAPICTGGTVNLSANATGGVGAYIYTWNGPALASTTTASPSASPTATATYSVTVSNSASGCTNSTVYTTNVTVNAKPSAAPANDGPICTTGTVNLTANATGGAGTYIYTWSGQNLASATSAAPSATPTSSGIYSVTVANSASGCNAATIYTTSVTVAAQPSASPTNDGPLCPLGMVHLTANAIGGTGAYTYTWSGPSFVGSTTGATAKSLPASSSVYSVTVSNAASGCNSGTAYTTTVSVNAAPSASPTAAAAICVGGTATLSANATGGVGAYTYSWSGPNLSSATVANPTATPTVTSTYSVTVSNLAAGCSSGSAYVMTATVNALPGVYSVAGGGVFCQGSAGPHIMLSGSSSGVNYQLYRSGTLMATMAGTGSALDFGARNPGYTFTVGAVNATTSCTAVMSGSTTVVMNPLPTAYTVTGGGAYCSGGTGVHVGLSNSDTGFSYQLYNGAGHPVGSPLAGTGAALDFGLQTAAGTGYYVISTNNTTGCTKATANSVTVTINPLPYVFPVTGSSTYCAGGSGSALGLYSTVTGTNYQLYVGSTPVGSPVSGTGTTITFGYQSATGIYTVIGTNTVTGCVGPMTGSVSLGVGPSPTAYSVTGGGAYCSGGAGLHVGIAGSDAGVTYQLYVGGGTVGSAVSGTGAAIDFGLKTATGTYSVIANNSSTGCSGSMSNTVSISTSSLPAAYSVTGGGGYCSGGVGVHIGLGNSAAGVNYQLYRGTSAVGSPLSGTGAALDFGYQTTAGTYTVTATNGCSNSMTGSATVTVNALPTTYSMTGGGSYCAGGSGFMVYLASSKYGVNYQLYNNGTAVGSAVPGTGVIMNFGAQTNSGTYTVTATDATTGCTSNMSGSAVIVQNPLPSVYSTTGGGSYCAGGSGVAMGLTNSQAGISYQLYRSTSVPMGSAVAGTGSAISFANQTVADVYTVVASDASTGCSATMSGSKAVTINPLPVAMTVAGGGGYCSGSNGVRVGTLTSAVGIDYQLYYNGTAVGNPIPGPGKNVDFGLQTAVGAYTVVGTNSVTGCTNNMAGSVSVSVIPLPAAYSVTGGGSYCIGGSGVTVGLSNSGAGIDYQLYVAGLPLVGTIHHGNGSAVNFGLQTTTGTYTIVATDTLTGCTSTMSGSAAIANYTAVPTYSVTGGGSACAGSSGIVVGLGNSDATVTYQLYRGTTAVGSAVSGTGSAINFGGQTTAGTYSVIATSALGCSSDMTGTASVVINQLPYLFTVMGTASACSSTGADVQLSSSVTGTNYQLYYNGTAVGSAATGTGTPIDYGIQTASGTYTVVGTITNTGCSTSMTGSAVLTINPTPSISGSRFTVSRSGMLNTATLSTSLTGGAWTSDNSAIATVGSSTGVVTGVVLGATVITYTMPTGCYATQGVSVTVTGHKDAGGHDERAVSNSAGSSFSVIIAPNPNRGTFTVKGTTGNDKDENILIEIMDVAGRTVYAEHVAAQNGMIEKRVQLDNNIANGMYLLNLSTQGDRKLFHIVVER